MELSFNLLLVKRETNACFRIHVRTSHFEIVLWACVFCVSCAFALLPFCDSFCSTVSIASRSRRHPKSLTTCAFIIVCVWSQIYGFRIQTNFDNVTLYSDPAWARLGVYIRQPAILVGSVEWVSSRTTLLYLLASLCRKVSGTPPTHTHTTKHVKKNCKHENMYRLVENEQQ